MSDCWQYVLAGMSTTSMLLSTMLGECRESVSKLHGY